MFSRCSSWFAFRLVFYTLPPCVLHRLILIGSWDVWHTESVYPPAESVSAEKIYYHHILTVWNNSHISSLTHDHNRTEGLVVFMFDIVSALEKNAERVCVQKSLELYTHIILGIKVNYILLLQRKRKYDN